MIEATELTAERIELSNYITEDCRFLTDMPADSSTVKALVEQLKDAPRVVRVVCQLSD